MPLQKYEQESKKIFFSFITIPMAIPGQYHILIIVSYRSIKKDLDMSLHH